MLPSRLNIVYTAPWNDYQKVREIGVGSYASVWLAERAGVRYAIKETKIQSGTIDVLRTIPESFVRELSAIYNIQGRGASPQLFACYVTATSLYIVMEYFPTSMYMMILEKYPIPNKTRYIYSLVRQLHTLLSMGIQHRDIKPDNILMDPQNSNKAVFTDYGASRYMSYAPSQMTARILVPIYAPPEVILGDQYYSYAVDVWCLGMVFVEFLTGEVFSDKITYANALDHIRDLIGPPKPEQLGTNYQKYVASPQSPKQHLSLHEMMLLQKITPDELSFLRAMLNWDPNKRWAPFELLNHPYLSEIYGKFAYQPSIVTFAPRMNALYSGSVLSSMLEFDGKNPRKVTLSPELRYQSLYPIFVKIDKVKLETLHLAVYLFDIVTSQVQFSDTRVLALACLQIATYVYEIRTSMHISEYDPNAIRVTIIQVLDILGSAYYPGYITVYRLLTVAMDRSIVEHRQLHKQYMNIALLYGLNCQYRIKDVIETIIGVPTQIKNSQVYDDLAKAVNWYNRMRSNLRL